MITKAEVEHIAELARIKFTEKETEKLQKDLSQILEYFDTLKSVDTSHVNAMPHVLALENALRKDSARNAAPQVIEQLIKSAPNSENSFVKVKGVFNEL